MKKSKKKSKQLDITSDTVLGFVKDNIKVFLKYYWKRYDEQAVYSEAQESIRIRTWLNTCGEKADFNMGVIWVRIYRVITLDMKIATLYGNKFSIGPKEFRDIWDEIEEKVARSCAKKAKEASPDKRYSNYPKLSPTDTVRELLARGWVHKDDFDINPNKWYLKSHFSDLIYPKQFKLHAKAIAFGDKVGIPGRCGTDKINKD